MKLWQARLAFGSPDLSTSLLFATVNGWLLFYLVSVIGMPPLVAGAAFVFGRLLDGLLDPVVGAWTDRYGRKPVIAGALPVAALTFVALWASASLFDDAITRVLAITVAFSAFALAYTCVSIPRLGMLPGFVPGYHGRTGQAGVDMAFVFIAVLISSVAFPAVVATLNGGAALSDSRPATWIGVAAGMAVLAVLAYLPFIVLIREPERHNATHDKAHVVATLLALRHTPGALRTVLMFGCTVLALVTLQSMMPFWLEAGPGIKAAGQSIVLLIVFVATLASLPAWAVVSRRYGKVVGLRLGIGAFLAGIAMAMLLPSASGMTAQLVIASLVAGAGAGALSMFPWSMIPDVAEANSRRLGKSVEGTTTAAFTITNKMAAAAALFLNAAVLQLNAGPAGSADTPAALLVLPAFFAIVTLLVAVPGRLHRGRR